MPFAEAERGRLWYEVAGDGPAVVLLHAGIVDYRMWDAQLRSFAEHHRVLRYDLRGYGRSDRPAQSWSDTADLGAVMDAAGIEQAALVGNSLGGLAAIDFAAAEPERVWALVPVAAALRGYGFDDGATEEQTRRWEEAEERGDLDVLAEIDLELWAPLGADEHLRAMVRDNAHMKPGRGGAAAAREAGRRAPPPDRGAHARRHGRSRRAGDGRDRRGARRADPGGRSRGRRGRRPRRPAATAEGVRPGRARVPRSRRASL